MNAAFLLASAALIVSVISFVYLKFYLKRRTSHERILSELREEVNKILRSIDETTDRDISLIEEREKTLRSLLEDIEKRLKVYVRETEKRREAEEALAALSPPPAVSSLPAAKQAAPSSPAQSSYQELGKNRYRINRPQSLGEEQAAPAFPLPSFQIKPESLIETEARERAEQGAAPSSEAPPKGEQIRDLVKAGFSAPIIASRLDLSIAEVEFVEALLERKAKQ